MPVILEDTLIVMQNEKRNIALYDKKNKTYIDALSLYRPKAMGVMSKTCCATIWYDTTKNTVMLRHTTIAPDIRVAWQLKPDIFLSGTEIVIGVGDMRDGIADAQKGVLDIKTIIKPDEFVIEFIDESAIQIRYVQTIKLVPTNIHAAICQ